MFYRTVALAAFSSCLLLAPAQADESAELSELIDRQIQSRLDAAGLARAPSADDAEFVRRAFLDLHGVVPSAERTVEFLDSGDVDKRSKLIEELLADSRFGERFGDIWRTYLVAPLANEDPAQGERFAAHLAERVNAGAGWDEIAFDLVTASGTLEENPAVAYLIEGRHPLGVTDLNDLTSRYFLGVQLNCAQCHDHPFVDLTQQDYWGMAAFFTEIQTPGRPKAVYRFGVQDDPKILMEMLDDDAVLDQFRSQAPTFLGGERIDEADPTPRRVALARWMTSPDNPYFARAAVNRTWRRFFGRGIVEPVDDMHAGNVPSHPETLEELSRRFADSGFDLKLLCRAILNSRTYQQTSRTGDAPDEQALLFGRMSVRTLAPEEIYDSLVTILGPPVKSKGGSSRFGGRDEFCRFFATDGDLGPTRYERGIPHALRQMNSSEFAGGNLQAFVARIESSTDSTDETIESIFLTVLSRRPTPDEIELAQEHLHEAGDSKGSAYRELTWALLMSSEFLLNH